jgi:hypothetical protein
MNAMSPALPTATTPTTTREFMVDLAAIAAVSLAICVASHELLLMTVVVPAVWVLRTLAWAAVRPRARHALGVELAFCLLAAAFGGFNDWLSTNYYGIYDYTVPTDLPGISTLPVWLLLYWGIILRFVATLASYQRLGDDPTPRDLVRVGHRHVHSAALKIALQLAIVLATRQAIFRTHLDPIWSWAPFLVAGGLHALLFPWDRRDLRIAALALTIGTAVEVLYIQVGGLHRYDLGWIGGVPIWIALWWALAMVIWRDLGLRILRRFARWAQRTEPLPRGLGTSPNHT